MVDRKKCIFPTIDTDECMVSIMNQSYHQRGRNADIPTNSLNCRTYCIKWQRFWPKTRRLSVRT